MSDQPQAGAVIYAKEIDRVSRFYREALGFQATRIAPDHQLLEIPGFQLVIHSIPAAISETITITDPPELRTDAAQKLIFYVAELGVTRQTAMKLGGGLNPPESEWQFQGHTVCDGYDPEGNIFQLRQIA